MILLLATALMISRGWRGKFFAKMTMGISEKKFAIGGLIWQEIFVDPMREKDTYGYGVTVGFMKDKDIFCYGVSVDPSYKTGFFSYKLYR